MHYLGLHNYKTQKRDLLFLNIVSKNKDGFNNKKINITVNARDIQPTLGFSTVKEVKWVIIIKEIQEFPVETKNMDNSETIWGKYLPYLKGKTNRKNPILLNEDLIRFPKEF